VLTYGYSTPGHPANQPGSLVQRVQDEVAVATAAGAHFTNLGIDLSGYTIKELAADVNDLRTALNYDRVTLIGHSFGGQWAFATIRLFPQIVARAIIAGVEPLGCAYDMPSEVLAALRKKWTYVETLPDFQNYLPADGTGIEGAVRTIITRLNGGPESSTFFHPATGVWVTVALGRDDFRVDWLSPAEILEIYHRKYEKWAKWIWDERRKHKVYVGVIKPLIDTGLSVTASRLAQLQADPALDVLSQRDFEVAKATESIWPTPDVGDAFRNEITTNTPVLFVQGEWDAQTPPGNLAQVQSSFVNSKTILVTNTGHAVHQDLEATPDLMNVVLEFIKSGSTTNLPPSWTLLPAPHIAAPNFPLP
jgi:pimeloyl-ACP methyl ester carboxylesterase